MLKPRLALLLTLALLPASGCTSPGSSLAFWPFNHAKKAHPGVISPTDQIAMLRDLSKKASTRTAQQKSEIAANLVSMLPKESDPLVRAQVIRTMRHFPTPATLGAVRAAAKDSEADVRLAACESLGQMGGADVVATLAEALKSDVDADVRLAAARALGQTHDPSAVAVLGGALDDTDPAMQYRVVMSLKDATGKDLGNDVHRWQQYVKGEVPAPEAPVSLAERFRRAFQ
jgi:HEAT repeat protein